MHTATQFYAARFFLGATESSFFPGMIVYLTHWFCTRHRSRAIACLYAANPAAALIGSPLDDPLLGVYIGSRSLAGAGSLFLEGIPAIVVGAVTYFYMTDRPVQAHWVLPMHESVGLARQGIGRGAGKRKARFRTLQFWKLLETREF